MSKSVANSLRVLIEIGTSGFEDALATAEFLGCFDTSFDMMNSKFAFFMGQKHPFQSTMKQSGSQTSRVVMNTYLV